MGRLQPSFEDVFRDLVEFAHRPEFAEELERAVREYFGEARTLRPDPADADEMAFLEWLIFDRTLPNVGTSYVEHFLEHTGVYEGADRDDLLGWIDSSVSFFEVRGVDAEEVRLQDILGQRRREVCVADEAGSRLVREGDVVMARLLPWRGRLHFAGALNVFPDTARGALLDFLADMRGRVSRQDWSRILKDVLPALSRCHEETDETDDPLFPGGYPDYISSITVDTWMAHGRSCLARGDYRSALLCFQRVLFEMPSDLHARNCVGLVHLSRGEFGSARKAFQSVLGVDPTHALALLNLGNTELLAGRLEDALEALMSARASAEDDGVRSNASFNIGLLCLLGGDDARAIRYFREASRLAERVPGGALDDESGLCERAAVLNFRIGTNLAAGEHWLEAVKYLRKSVRQAPENGPARLALADAYAQLARWREAASEYRKVLRATVCNGRAWNALGRCYLRLGQYQAAEEALRRAIELLPGLVEAHDHLGQAIMGQNRLEEARDRFAVALRHAPKHFEALLHAGEVNLKLRDFKTSERLLKRALRMAPSDPRARHLGSMLQEERARCS